MEVFINLTKNDTVVAIDENIVPGSLVFDSLNAFPGYYHERPTSGKAIYMYLVLDKQYALEQILRATQNIEQEYSWNFDAGKGYMVIGSEFLNVIRIRHLPQLEMVEKIQQAYQKQGINFLMNKKLQGKLEAEVKISKFIDLEEIGEGVFINKDEPSYSYVEIPTFLSREKFSKVSMDVKFNWEGHEYDAAAGSFYCNGKLHEVVRILSSKNDLEYLSAIRKLYLGKMN